MEFLFVGIFAAAIAWANNQLWIWKSGTTGLIIIAPLMEEILKTGGAVLFAADIFLVHITFGTIEAVYDINSKNGNLIGGILSFVGHAVFGYIALLGFELGGTVWSLFFSFGSHVIWNTLVVFIVNKKKIS